jgi:signal transduction histidine kinase
MKRDIGRAAIVLLAVALATGLTEASFALGAELTFEWYVAAVACIACWYGRTPALVAAVSSALISDFLFLPFHRFSFGMGLTDGMRLLGFVGLASLIAHLVAARNVAEKERVGRERLLAMAAHELANMILAVRTWTAILRRDGLDGGERDHAADALARTNRTLMKLAGDLGDWSRIAAGHLLLEPEDLDMADVVREAVEEIHGQATEQAVTLSCSLHPAPVHADRDRLHQVALDLLADSLKATDHGGTLTISVRSSERRGLLSVHGMGDGILHPIPQKLLDPATDPAAASIGMALSRDLIRAQGGDVTVHGGGFRGAGATLVVRLPTAVLRTSTPMRGPAAAMPSQVA